MTGGWVQHTLTFGQPQVTTKAGYFTFNQTLLTNLLLPVQCTLPTKLTQPSSWLDHSQVRSVQPVHVFGGPLVQEQRSEVQSLLERKAAGVVDEKLAAILASGFAPSSYPSRASWTLRGLPWFLVPLFLLPTLPPHRLIFGANRTNSACAPLACERFRYTRRMLPSPNYDRPSCACRAWRCCTCHREEGFSFCLACGKKEWVECASS